MINSHSNLSDVDNLLFCMQQLINSGNSIISMRLMRKFLSWGPIKKGPLSNPLGVLVYCDVRGGVLVGPLIDPQWCRETSVSQTADVIFSQFRFVPRKFSPEIDTFQTVVEFTVNCHISTSHFGEDITGYPQFTWIIYVLIYAHTHPNLLDTGMLGHSVHKTPRTFQV